MPTATTPRIKERFTPIVKHADILLCATLLAASIALDVHSLTAKSLWMDEGFSVYMAQADWANFWRFIKGGEINMMLYYLALRLWMHFGQSEFWIRLLSVAPAVATAPVVYALGKRLFGTLAGFAAALLLALHPSELMYAQEIRSYSLAVLLVALSSVFFLRAREKASLGNWAGYVLCSALACYAHVFSILVLIAQWMWLTIFHPEQLHRREFRGALLTLVMLALPILWIVLASYKGAIGWVPATSAARILDVWRFLSLPKWRGFLYLSAWMTAMAGFARSGSRETRSRLSFLLCWLGLPFLLTLLISVYKPLLVERFLLVCLPASILLAMEGVRQLPRWLGLLAFLLLAFFSYNSALSYYRHFNTREDWRAATAYVLSHAQTGDTVVVVPEYCRFTFDYYRQHMPAPESAPVSSKFETGQPFLSARGRTWLLVREQPRQPDVETFLQELRSDPAPYRIAESRPFNFISVLLITRTQAHSALVD